jgi:hypothetical protein
MTVLQKPVKNNTLRYLLGQHKIDFICAVRKTDVLNGRLQFTDAHIYFIQTVCTHRSESLICHKFCYANDSLQDINNNGKDICINS